MLARLLLLPLAVLLVLPASGCRDTLVDPVEDPIGPPDPASDPLPAMYMKGPASLSIGAPAHFRAEAVPGAVRYHWYTSPEDAQRLTGRPLDMDHRTYEVTAIQSGPPGAPATVRLQVLAYDSADERIAGGEKIVEIRQ